MTDGASDLLIGNVRILRASMSVDTKRAGGPGGQHVNTSDSAVRLRVQIWGLIGLSAAARVRLERLAGHRLTADGELLISVSEHRSQQRNREAAWQRLRELVQQAMRVPKTRKQTKPSRGSVVRRLDHKRQHSDKKNRRRQNFDE